MNNRKSGGYSHQGQEGATTSSRLIRARDSLVKAEAGGNPAPLNLEGVYPGNLKFEEEINKMPRFDLVKEKDLGGLIKIGEIKSFKKLMSLFETLRNNYQMTNFDAIIPLIQPALFLSDISLVLREEGSLGKESTLKFHSDTKYDFRNRFSFEWNTSSNHRLIVEGLHEADGANNIISGEYDIYIGDDHSEWFYPEIKKMVDKIIK